tara:strand:+ start:105 stop:743 length:639 start_codon:yes stop_codon:yes gene_type:complete
MYTHNPNISNLIRDDNNKYNQLFLKKFGLLDYSFHDSEIHAKNWQKLGYNYFQTIWFKNIERLMSFLHEIDVETEKYNFLDIGSGNGIATIYFANKYNFNLLEGIEINHNLYKDSKHNLEIYNRKSKKIVSNIKFINSDILNHKIRNQKYILFMFNSMEFKPLEKFIKKNIKELRENKSYFLLANDLCINEILTYSTLIKRDNFYNISAIRF